MKHPVSIIWRSVPADAERRLLTCINGSRKRAKNPISIFFRADDIGVPSTNFSRLLRLFSLYRMPLNLAVVPAWLTTGRWKTINRQWQGASNRISWHQHGWRHKNHEPLGKNQEFGPSRAESEIAGDLLRGRDRLEQLMGEAFFPVFTPPWNRCDRKTLNQLSSMSYRAVSRTSGSRPKAISGLMEIPVNVDLHTLTSPTAVQGWNALFSQFERSFSTGTCGIMIHHQRMDDTAFDFLEILLDAVSRQDQFVPATFPDLVRDDNRNPKSTNRDP